MKTKSTLVIAVIALLGMSSITSCKKKKTIEEDETLVPASGYVLGLKTTSAGAESSAAAARSERSRASGGRGLTQTAAGGRRCSALSTD